MVVGERVTSEEASDLLDRHVLFLHRVVHQEHLRRPDGPDDVPELLGDRCLDRSRVDPVAVDVLGIGLLAVVGGQRDDPLALAHDAIELVENAAELFVGSYQDIVHVLGVHVVVVADSVDLLEVGEQEVGDVVPAVSLFFDHLEHRIDMMADERWSLLNATGVIKGHVVAPRIVGLSVGGVKLLDVLLEPLRCWDRAQAACSAPRS